MEKRCRPLTSFDPNILRRRQIVDLYIKLLCVCPRRDYKDTWLVFSFHASCLSRVGMFNLGEAYPEAYPRCIPPKHTP